MKEYINLCCVKCGNLSNAELARRTNQTPSNFNQKMTKNDFKVSDLEKIADALDADLQIKFIDRRTKEPII